MSSTQFNVGFSSAKNSSRVWEGKDTTPGALPFISRHLIGLSREEMVIALTVSITNS
ncbi:unnamed protein product [Medioppia subpectinata]|uniref:Uncharacterized protein n=1 Tax=Medioppia subpectinata TaxID=1979941 RepID=A0A7R9L9T1_9ACAR|nr:unnamed protein product [Medioppia subpectinata]CAG2117126.1 unnamed protein product [Medioppia subpectinata]